jgi:hypothetical protein
MPKRRKRTKAVSAAKIGPGNPPKYTQYRKGVSGNPKGRPKGSKNLSTLMMEAAHHPVSVDIEGKSRRITAIHATTLQLATKAAHGDAKATVAFLDAVDEIERRAAAARPTDFPLSERDIEVLRAAHARMLLCDPEIPEEQK